MVRLLLATVGRVGYDDVKFQSHNGAIAAALPLNRFVRYEGFNPTMVRLLQCCQNCAKVGKTWFQSHNGAIAAPTTPRFVAGSGAFQSHNGAIAAKAKFWGLRSKGKEMVRGLQSTFGCLKTLGGRRQLSLQNWAILG